MTSRLIPRARSPVFPLIELLVVKDIISLNVQAARCTRAGREIPNAGDG